MEVSAPAFQIIELGVSEVDRVEALWKEMVEAHREVIDGQLPVRAGEEAWERRRPQYVSWLEDGSGRMFAAVPAADPGAAALGYAVLVTEPPGPTWEMGERTGDLQSLVVAAEARGAGIGTALIEACRDALRSAGVEYWTVAVVEANERAARLYERAGFRPFYRNLAGRV
jgi:ribosomal protein S18 acetylase RimI-like enzyme